MEQPDFGADFGLDSPEKIEYSTRRPPLHDHDMLYLRSYIHDAEFLPTEIQLAEKILTIPLDRDCWELDYSSELLGVKSILEISDVISFSWLINQKHREQLGKKSHRKFCINTMFHGEEHYLRDSDIDVINFVDASSKIRLVVRTEYFPLLSLKDLAIPVPWRGEISK